MATEQHDNLSVEDSDSPGVEVVQVLDINNVELSSFFITSDSVSAQPLDQEDRQEASIDTFNDIFIDSNDMYDTVCILCCYCNDVVWFHGWWSALHYRLAVQLCM